MGVPPGTLQLHGQLASLASVFARLLLALVAAVTASLHGSVTVAAHNGIDPWLEVTSGVRPAGSLSVVGGELDRDGLVHISLWIDGRTHRIGELRADGEGHFAGELPLPAGIGEGYGQLTAATINLDISLWFEIGGVAGRNSAGGDAAWLRRLAADPSSLLLGGLLAGGALGLGYLILWPGRRRQQTARR